VYSIKKVLDESYIEYKIVEMQNGKVLVSGASFAGLSTAYWMSRLGYHVTVVEAANAIRTGGTAVNIEGNTLGVVERMGILEQIRSNRLNLEVWEYKNADDVTEGSVVQRQAGEPPPDDELEIERNTLLRLLFDLVKNDVEFIYDDSITALSETPDDIRATFRSGSPRSFELVFGCDGLRSTVRKLWFGSEAEYTRFLEQYFSITIVDRSLIRPNTAQMFNVPGKGVMLNAYKGKTDIVFCFVSEKEIPYDHRDEEQQRRIVSDQLAGLGWRTPELLEEMKRSNSFYFDKLCQVRMPSWTKGRVALVGDAAYCASPAAGKGGSLAMDGAAALADAFQKHPGNFELAFEEYDRSFRPFIEEVQAEAVRFGLEGLCPRTEEAIRKRNRLEIEPFEPRASASGAAT
jgi:2-polyprenyl-6-methoxyphenol hydroxylase-like FAD-dependent oxidoreductase